MFYLITIIIIFLIIIISIVLYIYHSRTREQFLTEQMDYPYRIQFGRQITEINPDTDGYYIIKLPLEIPGKPFVMASCNWNMYGTSLNQYDFYMNVKIFNTFPIDDSDQKYRNSFRFKLMPYKWWPQGGIEYISIHKNPSSTIDMIDMPYLIDYGSVSYKSIPTDPIYFSTAFHSAPSVIMPQIGNEARFGSVAKIVEVTPLYFRLERLEYNVKDPPPFIEWFAILENPGSAIRKEDLPFLLDFGVNGQFDEPSYPLMLNGQTADVPGLMPLKTKFTIPPTIINGPPYNPITQISTEYFMYSKYYYECSWLAVQMKNQDPFINLMTPRTRKTPSYTQCSKTEYINLEQCGSHIYDYPATCPTYIIPYIPTLTCDYLPRKDFIPPDPPLFSSPGTIPYLVDVVVLTLDVHVDIKKVLWNETITFSTSSDRPGYIQVGGITPVVKKTEWSFPISVNLSGGIYSKCASMGNVMFSINTGNVDLIRFKLIFNIGLDNNPFPNFQYYVQMNKDDNLIYGPFRDRATIIIGLGADKCGLFNVKCLVDRYFQIHCSDIVDPIAQYEKTTLSKDINKFCDTVTEGLISGCFFGMGGPENPLSYIICVPAAYTANNYCKNILKKDMTPSEATDEICKGLIDLN